MDFERTMASCRDLGTAGVTHRARRRNNLLSSEPDALLPLSVCQRLRKVSVSIDATTRVKSEGWAAVTKAGFYVWSEI